MTLDYRKAGFKEGEYTGGTILLDGVPIRQVCYCETGDAGKIYTYDLSGHPVIGSLVGSSEAFASISIKKLLDEHGLPIPHDIGLNVNDVAYWFRRGKVEVFTAVEWAAVKP